MPKSHKETQPESQLENQSGIRSELQGDSRQDSEPDFSAEFNADTLIQCYRHGIFPMSDGRDDRSIFLLDPEMRGILPLDQLHISKSMRKFMRKTTYDISFNQAFPDVIKACALCRDDTWISHDIEYLYRELFLRGHAHSVEIWDEERLIGGLYGVSQGGAFFGESMFSLQSNASKLALIKLVERLNQRGFTLLDTQFLTEHLQSLGAVEIARADYKLQLRDALRINAIFYP